MEKFRWAPPGMTYSLFLKDGNTEKYTEASCFGSLSNTTQSHIISFKFEFPICNLSEGMYIPYLEYVVDMFKLDMVELKAGVFHFRAFSNYAKNLMVVSIVRFLYEHIGSAIKEEIQFKFIKDIVSKEILKDTPKFERFCTIYKEMGVNDYFHDGHSWHPSKTIIRSYKEFSEIEIGAGSVNYFFTNGN